MDHSELDQIAGQAGRVNVALEILDLHGGDNGALVDHHERGAIGHTLIGDRNHVHTTDLADCALGKGFPAQGIQVDPLLGQLQGVQILIGNQQGHVALDALVALLVPVLDNELDDVFGGGGGGKLRVHTGILRPLLQTVGVQFGNDMLLSLGLHDGADLVLVHDLHVVALVHGQAKGLVLAHGEGLLLVADFLGIAVPAAGSDGFAAVVILERLGFQALDVDCLYTGKLHIQAVVEEAVGLGRICESFHQLLLVSLVKVNCACHVVFSFPFHASVLSRFCRRTRKKSAPMHPKTGKHRRLALA